MHEVVTTVAYESNKPQCAHRYTGHKNIVTMVKYYHRDATKITQEVELITEVYFANINKGAFAGDLRGEVSKRGEGDTY
ncbi:MAG: hypothetical protein M0Z77_07425 [Thermoplasmatales archaeon]|nr:hypothetical protein [Thermoplasmatales archaeon]